MSKTTPHQRMISAGQPYTSVVSTYAFDEDEEGKRTIRIEDGKPVRAYSLIGNTLEQKFTQVTDEKPDGDWFTVWETHDLKQHATLEDAHEAAAAWRESLVGVYAIA